MIKKKFYHNEVCLIKLPKFKDQRGYFMEVFQEKKLKKYYHIRNLFSLIIHAQKNVLRGMHFQIGRSSQGKLIRVTKGSIYDVIVNLDKKSKYFGEYLTFNIKNNNELLWFQENMLMDTCHWKMILKFSIFVTIIIVKRKKKL